MCVVSPLCLLGWHLSQQGPHTTLSLVEGRGWYASALRLLVKWNYLCTVSTQFGVCLLQLAHILQKHRIHFQLVLMVKLLVAALEAVGTVTKSIRDGWLLASVAVLCFASLNTRLCRMLCSRVWFFGVGDLSLFGC